jgi:hypothetical protein
MEELSHSHPVLEAQHREIVGLFVRPQASGELIQYKSEKSDVHWARVDARHGRVAGVLTVAKENVRGQLYTVSCPVNSRSPLVRIPPSKEAENR